MLDKHVPIETTKQQRLDLLERMYCVYLCEDGRDGTRFDGDILDAIKALKEKYKNSVD